MISINFASSGQCSAKAQVFANLMAGLLKRLAQHQIRHFLGGDGASGTGNTAQGCFVAALVTVQAIAQANHHQRKSECVFVSISLIRHLVDQISPFSTPFLAQWGNRTVGKRISLSGYMDNPCAV
ncbi:MAG: hypothetical protein R2873_07265 [Caldilineaceae bacterium]